jgi:integrase
MKMAEENDINFTKAVLLALKAPEDGAVAYRDSREKGLNLYITASGHRSFMIRRKVRGQDKRIILGHFPEMTIEQARKAAQKAKGQIASGKDPEEEKRRIGGDITFGDGFRKFMDEYSRPMKKSWKYDEREVQKFLSRWMKRKMGSLGKWEVQDIHERIGRENGKYQANRILERIRAIYNKMISWGWDGENPTSGVKKFREQKRDRFIMGDEFPKFMKSLEEEENEIARDYFCMCLLTGARKSNVLSMKWDEIDFMLEIWRIPDTKNGEPAIIPLIGNAMELLRKRISARGESNYVFPSKNSRSGHLADPQTAWERILKRAGIEDLRIHDLRRTMGSYQAITGAAMAIIGKSLGYKSTQSTEIYARLSRDPVRAAMEAASKKMKGL